jgi:hypothetical protein
MLPLSLEAEGNTTRGSSMPRLSQIMYVLPIPMRTSPRYRRNPGTEYQGTKKQITFNKDTNLHDALYKRRKPTHTDYRKTEDVISGAGK